ncbi:hydantoinase B/oxoprolinase family protein [Peribacillus frigoritolerans]|uniref:hydantoinase B/oxoprolinase family protein n=1 Tax=Peribacillus frigoritolerans TaxID=450367 RepID=UPI002079689D|nr:hydantoinase B/oxoprolinase family protein [Peribacillus frigoritolerans]USK77295.1 hydantoinase B/oxoprolinase family protein [Peribacillus frigoritolerans]
MDYVTMNIINSAMISICREMGITLMKTSYSTIFNEALDFTCGLANTKGELIAVADYCPAMIGGMPVLIDNCIKEIPVSEMKPGDVILHNDPYRGGLHIPEHTLFKPIFIDGEVVGYAVAIGHIAEIGGIVPGGFAAEATEVFQEGIRLPPVKIINEGKDNEAVWKIMLANVRTPRHNYGDLRALISSVNLGESRLSELIIKYGKEIFTQTVDDLLDYSERRMRAELKGIPNGYYDFEDYIENDGIEDKTFTIKANVYVDDEEVIVDYTGTSPQARGPINATYGVSVSAAYNALLHITDPEIPKNSGCFRPIKVVAPPGTVVNVDFPAPEVGGNTETHPRIALAIIGAFSKAIPEKVMACEGGTHLNFVFGGHHDDYDEYYVCYDLEAVGWGARPYADGNNMVDSINGNCRTTPTEVFETRFPWLIESFNLNQDSGGPGKYRGGLGAEKVLKCVAKEITVSQMSDRHQIAPFGLFNGQEGGLGATLVMKNGESEWKNVKEAYGKVSSSKFSNLTVKKGDRVKIVTPGGGGYGDPCDRDRSKLEEDIKDGFVSEEAALSIY